MVTCSDSTRQSDGPGYAGLQVSSTKTSVSTEDVSVASYLDAQALGWQLNGLSSMSQYSWPKITRNSSVKRKICSPALR
ncbi:hypothetical protein BX600DRAFT_452128 [Xylariales sp. PMI_506]|nr:hypothetical protein BX600DRAFT_452128 [Xylariales sp. PMI_506]